MARESVHTVPTGRWWKNEIEGVGVLFTYDTKDEAVQAGREEARRRGTEHVIHEEDGSVAETHSYVSETGAVRG